MTTSLILVFALLLDAMAGEPKWLYQRLPHPVVLMSGFLMAGERLLNKVAWPRGRRRLGGICLIVGAVAIMAAAGIVIEDALAGMEYGYLILVLLAAMLLAARSLYDHVRDVKDALISGAGLDAARATVGKIIGRRTDDLDETAISRASIESLAESFSDGVVAPAFWFLLAGLPGLLVFKMVSTADSMIGYRNDRYQDFGWAAARLDDVLNLLPARLTALLFALVAIWFGRGAQTLGTAWQQARRHASPNAGWPEAAMAGALDIRLGGPRIYPGEVIVDGAWFGSGGDANTRKISQALQLSVLAWLAMVLLLLGWSLV
jgi:adenosylcobinamide-phosphate synthase